MTRLAGAFVLLTLLALPAEAQPIGVWEHRFSDHTVYLRVDLPMLEVWRVDDRGNCTMMPSAVRWDEGDIVHSAGTRWTVDEHADSLTVALPDTTLEYRKTRVPPAEQCDAPEKI